MKLFADNGSNTYSFDCHLEGSQIILKGSSGIHSIRIPDTKSTIKQLTIDGKTVLCSVFRNGSCYVITLNGIAYSFSMYDMRSNQIHISKADQVSHGETTIIAPIPGFIKEILVRKDQEVKAGMPLCTLIAMKMENEISSSVNGRIVQVFVEKNAIVNKGQPIFKIITS